MKKHKNFDCVQMKLGIQRKIAKEAVGISDEEFDKNQMGKINRNPILGPFLKKVELY